MSDWAKDKRKVWDAIVDKYGGKKETFDWGTWQFFDWSTGKHWRKFDGRPPKHFFLTKPTATISSMSKARKYGYQGYIDSYDCYVESFKEVSTLTSSWILSDLTRNLV
jgi:hypothetical protein